jgi:hypothetical protein
LIIARRGVKPAVVMKTLGAKVVSLCLTVIAIITVLICCAKKLTSQHDVDLQFGNDKTEYVEVYQEKLNTALAHLKAHGGTCLIAYLDDDGQTLHHPYPPCSDMELKTDKVTISANAKHRAAGDPNVTYRIRGNGKDVSDVLNSFK